MSVAGRPATRDAILVASGDVLVRDPDATVDALAEAAHVSRATFYRHFRSRVELLEALVIEPDPGTRERILAAAAELVGRDGLRAMSMDELAVQAGVSRASVYRLFPGKPALFEALLVAYSPFERIQAVLAAKMTRPRRCCTPSPGRRRGRCATASASSDQPSEVTTASPDALTADADRPDDRGARRVRREMAADGCDRCIQCSRSSSGR
jgi:AcrR family transcriptional regulator